MFRALAIGKLSRIGRPTHQLPQSTNAYAAAAILTALLAAGDAPVMSENLKKYVAARVTEFEQIPAERREQLAPLVEFVRQRKGQPIQLTFICTHNSRRSHLSQVWAKTAAAWYGVHQVETYSGGTEATAFNPRAVAALRRAGFTIPEQIEVGNPRYEVKWDASGPAMVCFSKKYDQAPNPGRDFAAVMTCTQADRACPIVPGAAARIAIPYEDPKVSDNTPDEARRTTNVARRSPANSCMCSRRRPGN